MFGFIVRIERVFPRQTGRDILEGQVKFLATRAIPSPSWEVKTLNILYPKAIGGNYSMQADLTFMKLRGHRNNEELVEREKDKLVERLGKACAQAKWKQWKWQIISETEADVRTEDSSVPPEHRANPKSRKAPPLRVADLIQRTVQPNRRPKTNPQVNKTDIKRASDTLKMAADATRLGVLMFLHDNAEDPSLCVNDLCDIFEMSQPALSHHLALLRSSGLVIPVADGKERIYGLTDKGYQLAQVLSRLCDRSNG